MQINFATEASKQDVPYFWVSDSLYKVVHYIFAMLQSTGTVTFSRGIIKYHAITCFAMYTSSKNCIELPQKMCIKC